MFFHRLRKRIFLFFTAVVFSALILIPVSQGQTLPPRTDFGKRVGIVYSTATADRYWNFLAYSQLFGVAQHQAMMAGVPFDLLDENDLTDIGNLVNYDALIFPYFANVPAALLGAIQTTLTTAVNDYHIGLIAAGEFMTVDENGVGFPDYQARMNNLLNVQITSFSSNVTATMQADAVTHPAMKGYAAGESILQYLGFYFPNVVPFNDPNAVRLVKWVLTDNSEGNAVLASELGARKVFFTSEQFAADTNLLWQAIQWTLYGTDTPVALKMTRFQNILSSRTDVDQSGYPEDVVSTGQPFHNLLAQWKNAYNFVGTLHINVDGSGSPSITQGIDAWLNVHQQNLALGNEIGTHSWSHPQDTGLLNTSQLEFEFNQSKNMIGQKLGITVVGTAIPGNAEPLSVDQQLNQYFSYITGRYGYPGSGYGPSIGFLTPDDAALYFHMNFKPDYTLLSWEQKSPAQAEQEWKDVYTAINHHANQPIAHWMWHDYGPTSGPNGDGVNYTTALFDHTISWFYNGGSEFATQADVTDRILVLTNPQTDFLVTPGSSPDDITVQVAQNNVGKFEAQLNTDKVIQSVDQWYAYNDKAVFLKKDGGTYNIHLGSAADPVTHITALPMRAELISVSGTGSELEFSFQGSGKVTVALNIPETSALTVEGADSAVRNGDVLTLVFNQEGLHNVTVRPENTPPQVSWTSPAAGSVFTAPADITLTADAFDSDGTIAKLEFFSGAVKLGEVSTSPYNFNWNAVPAGTYVLTATATDNLGAATTSAAVSITVNAPNVPPTVNLTEPADGAVFTLPTTINITASATDTDGSVAKVEFFSDGNKIGESTAAPYIFAWSDAVAGPHSLSATVTDNLGATATSAAVGITVNAVNVPPTVNLTQPSDGAAFNLPTTINLAASATDTDGSVAKVEFFSDGNKLGEATAAPYTFAWSNAAVGTHSLTATATDNLGATTTSAAISITVNAANVPPTVNFTEPGDGAIFTLPTTINLAATASDTDGSVAKVEFFSDGNKIGEATAAPYTFAWSNAAAGPHSLIATATDSLEATTTSAAVSITVNAANVPPTVSLIEPGDGVVFNLPTTINLAASATDTDGSVAKVEFFSDGNKIGEATSAPYAFAWNSAAAGTHSLTATATDNLGATTTSAAVSITVNAANVPPTVNLTQPSDGELFNLPTTINLAATATDTDGSVTKVEFFAGTRKLGEDTTAPFTFAWSNAKSGTYSLTARATDNLGAVTTSNAVSIVVNASPTVRLTQPKSGSTFRLFTTINMAATAGDADGSVVKVEFFADGIKLGEDTTSPYTFAWSNAAEGNHSLRAIATDNLGATKISSPVNIKVRRRR